MIRTSITRVAEAGAPHYATTRSGRGRTPSVRGLCGRRRRRRLRRVGWPATRSRTGRPPARRPVGRQPRHQHERRSGPGWGSVISAFIAADVRHRSHVDVESAGAPAHAATASFRCSAARARSSQSSGVAWRRLRQHGGEVVVLLDRPHFRGLVHRDKPHPRGASRPRPPAGGPADQPSWIRSTARL